MIRFLPDTWRDAVMRPFAMAAPDAGVYVELSAPDLRFAAIVLIGLIVVATNRSFRLHRSALGATVLWLIFAFAVWLATSGNGRYFMPALVIAGPVSIALVARLRATSMFRLTLAVVLVALQGWVVAQNPPWGWWGLSQWKQRYFEIELDDQARNEPATYITLSNISYSLIAPLFATQSRWVNISGLPDTSELSADARRLQGLLAGSSNLKVLVPTRPDYMGSDHNPSPALRSTIDDILYGQRLALAEPLNCRILRSRTIASMALKDVDTKPESQLAKYGFWVCDLRYPAAERPARQQAGDPRALSVFDIIERQCPRFFAPGQKSATRLEDGWVRMYPHSDLRLYVLDGGDVYLKYWRALNPEWLGTVDRILAGGEVNCQTIRGRSGLPWEREI
jgi:hypothetical protein